MQEHLKRYDFGLDPRLLFHVRASYEPEVDPWRGDGVEDKLLRQCQALGSSSG